MINTLNTCWILVNSRYIKIDNIGAIRYEEAKQTSRLYEKDGYVSVVQATPAQHKELCKTVGLIPENVLYEIGVVDGGNKI